jgi:FixJ family two-component response regulator
MDARQSLRNPVPTVFVIDDDPDVRLALTRLLESVGWHVATFPSAQRFLEAADDARGCIVLDLAMPGLNGLELQKALEPRGSVLPIVFLTGRGDVASSVAAMKGGAVDFLEKPVDDERLLAAVSQALAKHEELQDERDRREQVAVRLALLTARERQVLDLIVAGRLNKQIAAALGTVEKTIKFHRANVMHKMGVRTLADLVKIAERAGIGTDTGN